MSLSYSRLSTYRTCPRQYEYQFVKKLKVPMGPSAAFGVSVHSALAKFGNKEMENGEWRMENEQSSMFVIEEKQEPRPLALEELIEMWHGSFVKDGYEKAVEADEDRKRGEKLMEAFYEWWGKEERKVIAVEKGFSLSSSECHSERVALSPVEGRTMTQASLDYARDDAVNARDDRVDAWDDTIITGRFDRVEERADGSLRIIDFKTSRVRDQSEVDQDLQLSLYTLAAKQEWGREVSEVMMLYLCGESLTEVISQRSEEDLQSAGKTIQLLTEAMGTQDYSPTPSKEVCKCCAYRRVCDAAAV